MYTVMRTVSFKKAVKKCIKRGLDINKLSSKFDYAWECHIQPDWLLIWKQDDDELILLLVDTGTHSDVF